MVQVGKSPRAGKAEREMTSNWLVLVVNLLLGRNARRDTEEMSSAGLAVGYPRIKSCCLSGWVVDGWT